MAAKIAIGWTGDVNVQSVTASELTAEIDNDGPITIPTHAHNDRLALWHADGMGTLIDIRVLGGSFSELNLFGEPRSLTKDGVAGKVRLSLARRVGTLMSGEQIILDFRGE